MKRFLALTLALLIVMTMAACGGSGGKAADPNTLVVWHDKEAAVIEALQAYLDKALPDITVRFEKKTSLTDSLKLVGNDVCWYSFDHLPVVCLYSSNHADS